MDGVEIDEKSYVRCCMDGEEIDEKSDVWDLIQRRSETCVQERLREMLTATMDWVVLFFWSASFSDAWQEWRVPSTSWATR